MESKANHFILDFNVNIYGGTSGSESVPKIISVYALDYVITEGEEKITQTQFTPEEFIEKKEMLIVKARNAYNKKHKTQLDKFIGFRVKK